MATANEQDERIAAILADDEGLAFEDAVKRFFDHLKEKLELPCTVAPTDDLNWEEYYVIGPGDEMEYEQLKKTQPSCEDRFELLEIELGAWSKWMLFGTEDIGAHVQRGSDGRKFCLGLAELEATDRKSANHQLIDDYSVWFVNSR